jgi:tRNA (cytidine/uridine-2'-O-)-methyltransferase
MKHTHERSNQLPFRWPAPPFNVVLVEPEIPPNTGNIARLCAATGSPLHLVGPLGFSLTSQHLRRAGLDYWESVKLIRHGNWNQFQEHALAGQSGTAWFFSTSGKRSYADVRYQPGDWLIFGSESKGLPRELLGQHADHVLALPMQVEHVRSLNLATTAGIVLYEALRQCQ